MANSEILSDIARLLPEHQKEPFYKLMASFKHIPDDDEYLLILESIGFMTLLWKEVPQEVKEILEGANPVSETCHSVAKQIREAVEQAIPSHTDLMLISKRLEEHELALKRTISLLQTSKEKKAPSNPVLLSCLGGMAIGLCIYHFLLT